MRSLFKASLVAAAVVAAGTASAGTLTLSDASTPAGLISLSKEGALAGVPGATINSADVIHTVEVGYSVNDEITFTMTAGASASWPATINYEAGIGSGSMVSTLFTTSEDGETATYRVNQVSAEITAGETTIGATATITGITLTTAAIASGDIMLNVSSKATNGQNFDPATGVKLAESEEQFGDVKVSTPLNQEITVISGRKEFTDGDDDTLVWEASDNTDLNSPAIITGTTVVLSGDFSGFISEDFESEKGGELVYVDAAKQLTITYSSGVTTDTIKIIPDGEAVLVAQNDFSITAARKYGASATASATDLTADLGSANAGEWTLDGAQVNIPYMPYGNNISQILYVTNEGSLPGEISGTAFDENGMDYDLGSLGTVGAGSVKKVTTDVKNKLEGYGFTSGKVSITLTVNAPDDKITVYAAYNVGGSDRGTVNTDSYKGKINAPLVESD
jgi:hypothetical protein